MTAIHVFNAVLSELNKVKAPSLLLEDFNYFFNKTIIQYINKIYNTYEINQQKTDALRVLQTSSTITAGSLSTLFHNSSEINLPNDYLHILNCVVEFKVLSKHKCYEVDDLIQIGAKKLKSDNWSQVLNNYYFKPSIKNPYYYISSSNELIENLPVERVAGSRYGNSFKVKMEIRFGKNTKFGINKIYVDYIKTPQYINLTQEQLDDVLDNSQVLEFPDYVINEIINDLLAIIFENNSNPRLQTHIPINKTVNP